MAQPLSSQVETQETLTANWRNKIPVKLHLANDNISSPGSIKPLYVLLPRQGYLPSLAAQVWAHIQHVLPSLPGRSAAKPWFDCGGLPLRGCLPAGLLYDLLTDGGEVPWHITLHYTHLPEALVGWDNGITLQQQVLNSLKEACHICRGTEGSNAVMRLGGAAHDELWAAVERGDVAGFRSGMDRLKMVPTGRQGNHASIPVRLFVRRGEAGEGLLGVWDRTYSTSRPVPSHLAATPTTLAQVLHLILPHTFPLHVAEGLPLAGVAPLDPVPLRSTGNVCLGASSVSIAESQMTSPQAQGEAASRGDSGVATAQLGSGGGEGPASANMPGSSPHAGEQLLPPPSHILHPLESEPPVTPQIAQQPNITAESMPITTTSGTESHNTPPPLDVPWPDKPVKQSQRGSAPGFVSATVDAALGHPSSAVRSGVAQAQTSVPPGWPTCRVLVGGVEPPMETPIAWLHAAMHAPDYFVYVVVRLDV